jgi:hypothetical protein
MMCSVTLKLLFIERIYILCMFMFKEDICLLIDLRGVVLFLLEKVLVILKSYFYSSTILL